MNLRTRARLYLSYASWVGSLPASPRLLRRPAGWADAFLSALWLGFLDGDDLSAVTWSWYAGSSGFDREDYNLERGLWPWEAQAIDRHFPGRRRVLVAGAGGGREVIALARRGLAATAFDFSPVLTAACRRNLEKAGCSAQVLEAPPAGVPEGMPIHDALLVGRGVYHHVPERRRRVGFLAACRQHLEVGAPVILSDFFTRDVRSSRHVRIRAVARFARVPQGGHRPVELGDRLYRYFLHAFTRGEIEGELSDAGIRLVDYRISPFSEDSRVAHAVGRVL